MKGYKLRDSENKIVLSRHVTFDEASLLNFTVSQQMERMKTKGVLQWMEVDVTSPSPVGSVSVEISLNVTLSRDHVAGLDAEQVEDVKLFAAIGTKMNPQK